MSNLPSNDGYVAAAYLVFFALILIYVAIMAVKLTRIERELGELTELAVRRREAEQADELEAAPAPAGRTR